MLSYMQEDAASRAIYEAALEAVGEEIRTMDLGGHAHTDEFTDEVIKRVRTKLDVWDSLGESALEVVRSRRPSSGDALRVRASDLPETGTD